MPERVYGRRAMLNLPGHQGAASIVAEVTLDSEDNDRDGCELHISDCERTIHLIFGWDRTNDLHKIDTMIDALRDFRRGLVVHHRRKARESR